MIFKYQSQTCSVVFCSNADLTVGIAVVDGISQQIVKDPLQLVRITDEHKIVIGGKDAGQILILQHGLKFVDKLMQHQRQVDLTFFQRNMG